MKDNWIAKEMMCHVVNLEYHIDDKIVAKNKKIRAENKKHEGFMKGIGYKVQKEETKKQTWDDVGMDALISELTKNSESCSTVQTAHINQM